MVILTVVQKVQVINLLGQSDLINGLVICTGVAAYLVIPTMII